MISVTLTAFLEATTLLAQNIMAPNLDLSMIVSPQPAFRNCPSEGLDMLESFQSKDGTQINIRGFASRGDKRSELVYKPLGEIECKVSKARSI